MQAGRQEKHVRGCEGTVAGKGSHTIAFVRGLFPFSSLSLCSKNSILFCRLFLSFYNERQRTGLWPVRDLKGQTSQIAGEPNLFPSILCLKSLLKLPCNLHNSTR
jgi:hypothetical protein